MNNKIDFKKFAFVFVLLTFVSSAHAGVVVEYLNQEPIEDNFYNVYMDLANQHETVEHIAKHYDTIAMNFVDKDFRLVVEFSDDSIIDIRESFEMADLELDITYDEMLYLMDNYQDMSSFQKIRFIIAHDIPPKDALTLGSIAVSMWS
jgi:hypothetical protein